MMGILKRSFGQSILAPLACCSSTGWSYFSISRSVTGNTVRLYQLANTLRWQTANKSGWLTSLFSFNFLSNFPFHLLSPSSKCHLLTTTSLSTTPSLQPCSNPPGVFLLLLKGASPAARQSDVSVWEIPHVLKPGCVWDRPTYPSNDVVGLCIAVRICISIGFKVEKVPSPGQLVLILPPQLDTRDSFLFCNSFVRERERGWKRMVKERSRWAAAARFCPVKI